jgi:DNA polymerase V
MGKKVPDDPRDLEQEGFRSSAGGFVRETPSFDRRLTLRSATTFCWRVKGDELRTLGIKNGDWLVVDRSVEPRHDYLAVCAIDGRLRVRRLKRYEDGLYPVPLNRPFRDDPFERVKVWGIVRAVVRETIWEKDR